MAEEAALKCREAAGFWTESYPAMEFRHGPISVSEPGTVVWVFGAAPPGLADEVAATGARFVSDGLDPMVDLIRAQRLAVALARHAGRDPDRPRSLSFSVVLGDEQP
jgi:fructoselysine-6-P-deglycase FrlB-like protein